MNNGTDRFTCRQVNQLDIVDYLSSLGHHPAKSKSNEYWYYSPLRKENTPSFKVNSRTNVWYDFGLGRGGKLVDFGLLYYQCSVRELLEKFNQSPSVQQPTVKMLVGPKENSAQNLFIVSAGKLHSLSVLHYLKQRRISEAVAQKYCREIVFETNNRKFTAIGFRNDNGGYELRNQWFKGSSSPKAITSLITDNKELSVFEGFFDFLSYQTIYQQTPVTSDFLILNSTAFFEKSLPFMSRFSSVKLFLDRDKTGQNCTQLALNNSTIFSDESKLYTGYKDLNEWMQQIGKSQKKGLRL